MVAPTSVNGGRSSVSVLAPAPWPTMMSSRKSSSAGYRISSIARFTRWISSTKRTSRAFEAGEDRGHVALLLERRAGDRAQPDAELLADDGRERRLPEAGRADEEDVVERVAARLRRLERDLELLLRALLADEVGEAARAERLLDLLVALLERRGEELRRAHAALLSASRTRSSGGSSRSVAASAVSASTTE